MNTKELIEELRDISNMRSASNYKRMICKMAAQRLERLSAYEETGLEPEICANYKQFEDEAVSKGVPFSRIVELMEAERDGRLVVLPCKTGDTIYQLRGKKHAKGIGISPRIVSCAHVWSNGDYSLSHQGMTICPKKDLGRIWFLTREEAEAALEAQKGENHETDL